MSSTLVHTRIRLLESGAQEHPHTIGWDALDPAQTHGVLRFPWPKQYSIFQRVTNRYFLRVRRDPGIRRQATCTIIILAFVGCGITSTWTCFLSCGRACIKPKCRIDFIDIFTDITLVYITSIAFLGLLPDIAGRF